MFNQTTIGIVDDFHLLRLVGTGGSCEVFLGHQKGKTDEMIAIKMISEDSKFSKEEDLKMLENEAKILSYLKHKHIVKVYSMKIDGIMPIGNLIFKEPFTVMELAEKGCMIEYLENMGFFSEEISRHYFRQLIDGLEHIHQKGFIHRDIKPDNLLLNRDFDLLISDFGHSMQMTNNSLEEDRFCAKLGTTIYNPPETFNSANQESSSGDIFMAGAVLFILLTGTFPFKQGAFEKDEFYKHFYDGSSHKFWAAHLSIIRNYISEEAQSLVSNMLARCPSQRPSIIEIKAHPWYNGSTTSHEDVAKEMQNRVDKQKKYKAPKK